MGWPLGPNVSAQAAPNSTTAALAASTIVKATGGIMYGATITNTKASAQYIQVHDSAALPADAVVPLMSIAIAAHAIVRIDFGLRGRIFTSGIVLCNSSTDATKTIGSADCLFDVQYT